MIKNTILREEEKYNTREIYVSLIRRAKECSFSILKTS